LLVGNKCDLENQRQVTFEEGKELADNLGVKFIETSAKSANNVDKAFFTLANEIKSRVPKNEDHPSEARKEKAGKLRSDPIGKDKAKSGGCC
jgi:GTPase SAR1 family protein